MRMNTSSIVYLPELMGLEHDGTDTHCDPNEEYLFYRAVAEGAVSVVQDNCSQGSFENPEGKGKLSRHPLTNMKYHFVVTAALICRFCAESGMPMEEAYRLNDTYICQLDRCANIADVVLLHDQMAMDYTNRMLQRKKQAVASKQVSAAIDYIHTHLLERITVETLSKSVGVSSTFLSRILSRSWACRSASISAGVKSKRPKTCSVSVTIASWTSPPCCLTRPKVTLSSNFAARSA